MKRDSMRLDSSKETSLRVCRMRAAIRPSPVPDKPGKITLNTHYACGYRMAGHKMASTPAQTLVASKAVSIISDKHDLLYHTHT